MRSGWRLTTPAVLFINVGLARGNTKAAGTISACLLHQNHHRQMHLHAHPRMYSSGLCRGETKSACTSVATSQDNGSLCSSLWLCPPFSHTLRPIFCLSHNCRHSSRVPKTVCVPGDGREGHSLPGGHEVSKTAGRTPPVLEIRAVQKRKRM